jgi:hypothetical protein
VTAPLAPGDAARTLGELIARVAETVRGGDDPAARARAAGDVEQLRQLVAGLAGTLPGMRAAASGAAGPGGFDLAQIDKALGLLADSLRAPTPANEAEAQRALGDLQAAFGPIVASNPAVDDAERRKQIRQDARSALDDYFASRPKKP